MAGRRRHQALAAPLPDTRDPNFAPKAGRVLDLYARLFAGEPLGEDDFVPSGRETRCPSPPTQAIQPAADPHTD